MPLHNSKPEIVETTEAEKISTDLFEGQAAILKNVKKVNDSYYLLVDNIEEKYSSPNGNGNLKIEVINENPQVRTFRLSKNAVIQKDSCKNMPRSFFITNYTRYINKEKIAYTADNGDITALNLGCWQ